MSIFKNRTVIGVICILLALVICFGITPLFNQSISQKAEIVRVTKDIHAGELITKDMVTTAEVGSFNLPSGLMTAKDNVGKAIEHVRYVYSAPNVNGEITGGHSQITGNTRHGQCSLERGKDS